jgi:hypothetical protein
MIGDRSINNTGKVSVNYGLPKIPTYLLFNRGMASISGWNPVMLIDGRNGPWKPGGQSRRMNTE